LGQELREHLVAYFEAHHALVEASALQLLLNDRQPLLLSREIMEGRATDSPFVTREMVEEALRRRLSLSVSGAVALRPAARPEDAREAVPFALVREGFTGPPVATDPLAAYSALFQSRYRELARLLRGRADLGNLRPIRDLRPGDGGASVIGLVREVRSTAKHHLILTLDDESGSMSVLIPRDSPIARPTILSDEVVGVRLEFARDRGKLARVVALERPEVPVSRPTHRSARPSRVLFLSDLHIGSRSFLAECWGHLIDFLHGRGPRPEVAATIDHVVVAGDLVDGIGVYPQQERDLAIADIVEQYSELGRRLAELPDRTNVVVVPGNHDAVCPAEPQPALPESLRRTLPANVRSLSNPSTFALEGVIVCAYHGRSFDDLIPALPGADYARPTDVMKRMLSMRHLAPIYGDRTPLAPLPRDGLVIDPAPDILVTGHAHTYGADRYRGVLLLNASTWQAETEYQRMRNISPVPAHAAVVDLTSLELLSLDFSGGEPVPAGVAR
jgi:DNA polymerase II small subunit